MFSGAAFIVSSISLILLKLQTGRAEKLTEYIAEAISSKDIHYPTKDPAGPKSNYLLISI